MEDNLLPEDQKQARSGTDATFVGDQQPLGNAPPSQAYGAFMGGNAPPGTSGATGVNPYGQVNNQGPYGAQAGDYRPLVSPGGTEPQDPNRETCCSCDCKGGNTGLPHYLHLMAVVLVLGISMIGLSATNRWRQWVGDYYWDYWFGDYCPQATNSPNENHLWCFPRGYDSGTYAGPVITLIVLGIFWTPFLLIEIKRQKNSALRWVNFGISIVFLVVVHLAYILNLSSGEVHVYSSAWMSVLAAINYTIWWIWYVVASCMKCPCCSSFHSQCCRETCFV